MEWKNPARYYEGIKADAASELSRLSKLSATVSVVRLAIVVAAIACIWAWWGEAVLVGSTLAVGVVLFLALVIKHNKLFGKIAMQKALNRVATDNIRRINLELDTLDGGGEYVNPRHEYSYDLDLFGQRSIFTLLNSTATKGGERLLAGSLVKPELSAVEILKRQEAIKELAGMESFRTRFQAIGIVSKEEHTTSGELADCKFMHCKLRKWQLVSLYLFPSALAILIVLAVLGLDVSIWIETCAVLSLVVAGLGSKYVGQLHENVDKVVHTVSIYHNLTLFSLARLFYHMHLFLFRQYLLPLFFRMGKKNFRTGHVFDKDSLLCPFSAAAQAISCRRQSLLYSLSGHMIQ